jgi:hypothetical protein
MNLLRSHLWARRLASAAATFRDRPRISAKACSAVLSVLPAGVFMTTMPEPRGRILVDVVGAHAGPHDRPEPVVAGQGLRR